MRRRIIAGLLCAALAFYPEFTLAQIKPGGGAPVTPAGVSALSAGAIQGVTGGVPVPVTGTFTASLGGFTPSATGARMTPLAVTTADSSGPLAATGAVDVISNVGTNPMYCNVNGVAATTSDQLIGSNSWFAFTIPASITTLHCIATGGSTTANGVGGAGLPTGAGGGGGGGSGGVVTQPTASLLNATVVGGGGAALATAANQNSTAAGTSAANAQGVQGVTGGVPQSIVMAPATTSTANITVIDSGTTCTGTLTPPQTQCTGTPTPGSFVSITADQAGAILATGQVSGGTLSAVQFQTEISNDNVTWYGRGLFLDSNPTPIWRNGIANASFTGTAPGGVPFWRIRASTFTVSGGTPTVAITLTKTNVSQLAYVGNLPTASNGSNSVASVNVQGATGGLPVQIQGVSGGFPIPISGSVTASFSQFAPNGNYSTPLTVGATSARTALPGGGGTTVAIYNTGSNAAFVQLGSVAVVATASNDQVAPGGFICFAVGANVDFAAIETAGATTLNASGGSGGCASSGGGGGGSASGNVFQANIFDVSTASTSTTTQRIAASGALTIYLVNYAFEVDQAAGTNGTFQIVSGTGSNCASSQVALTPLWTFAAGGGIQEGSVGVLNSTVAGAALCVLTSTTNLVRWRIGAVQQ